MKALYFFSGAVLFLMVLGCSIDGNADQSCIPPPSGDNLVAGKTNLTVLALMGPNTAQTATNISVLVDGNWYDLRAQSQEAYSEWETVPSMNISMVKFFTANTEHTLEVTNSANNEPVVLFINPFNEGFSAELKNFLADCRDTF